MVYKGFFSPVLDFQKKIGFQVLDLGDLRVLENMSVLRPKPTHSIYIYNLRQMNTQVRTYIMNARDLRVKTKKYFKR